VLLVYSRAQALLQKAQAIASTSGSRKTQGVRGDGPIYGFVIKFTQRMQRLCYVAIVKRKVLIFFSRSTKLKLTKKDGVNFCG